MKYIRWITAWTLYWVGHAACRLMDHFDWEGPSKVLYPIYNRLMLASCDVQGPGGFGPWKPPGGLPEVRCSHRSAGDEHAKR